MDIDVELLDVDKNFNDVIVELKNVFEKLSEMQTSVNGLATSIAEMANCEKIVNEANCKITYLKVQLQKVEEQNKTIPDLEEQLEVFGEENKTIPGLKNDLTVARQNLQKWNEGVARYRELYESLKACDTMQDYYTSVIKADSLEQELINLIAAIGEKELSLDFAKKIYGEFEKAKSKEPNPMNEQEVDFIMKVNDFYKATGCDVVRNGIFAEFEGLPFGEEGNIKFDSARMIGIENRDNDEYEKCTSICVPLLKRTDKDGIAKKALVLAVC